MAINSQPKPILIILLLTIVANPLIIKLSESARTTKFDLIHRDQLPGRQNLTLAERVKQMLYRDMIHLQRLQTNHHNYKQQQNVGPRRQTLEDKKVAAVSKIRSGYDESSGEYFAEMTMGTPPKKFLLVADTGSDLTWVHCNYTTGNNTNQNPDQTVVFDADHSTSFRTINCSSTMCQENLTSLWSLPDQCPQQNDTICHYNYGYNGDFGNTQGIFAEETVTFDLTDGTTSAVNNTLIGCSSYSSQGIDQLITDSNGILGLGNNPLSLPNQLSKLFGQTFSYCLVDIQSDNTTSSKLFFGSPPQGTINPNGTMQTTQMVKVNSSYGLNIQNISIGGELVDIPAEAWDFSKGGGAIIDSGTTLAYLVESAYSPIIKALNISLSNFNRMIGPDTFELCYGSKEFNYSAVPEMVIGFEDGARFEVPGTSYVIDVDPDTKCLAFTMRGSGPSLIGNMLQQKNLWEFNIEKSQLSFGSSSCT